MDIYESSGLSFDIHETDNGKWNVILMPNLDVVKVGTGQYLGAFETQGEAERFCDEWESKGKNDP